MHGFKSFAKKEVLKLSQGVTTVVGPNGCGKTNIVDAIRWVLGEQKSSVLRGGKMEDVIFNGAENMKPLSVCDVTLTVHNNKGKLPIEYNDIEIGRRVYRNGESEYTINKTPCRLKDINDLFIDTGMGSDAYSVIELKMIEQILSENGDDRRRMFEEASGINKYRKQRKSTLRKFDATRFDLERINDVISEVEQKVHGLELQLKRFKRHENLTLQLREKDIKLAFLKVDKYQNIMSPLEQEIKDYNHLKSSKTDKSSKYEKVLEKNRLVYKEQEDELNALQAKLLTLTENRQEVRQNILIWTEKGNSTSLSIERGKSDYKTNHQRLAILSEEVDFFIEESEKLQNDLDLALSSYKNKKEEYVSLLIDEMIPEVKRQGIAKFIDVFCEDGYFNIDQSRRILEAGKSAGLTPRIHADEFYNFGASIMAGEVGAISADHLMKIDQKGIQSLKNNNVVATLLPGTTFFLNKNSNPIFFLYLLLVRL